MGLHRSLRSTFDQSVRETYLHSLRVAPIAGIGVGLGNSLTYAVEGNVMRRYGLPTCDADSGSALMFYVSALLIANGRYTYEQMMQVFTLIIFSVTFAGQVMSYCACCSV